MNKNTKAMLVLGCNAASHFARMKLDLLEPHVEMAFINGCRVTITVFQKNHNNLSFTLYDFYSPEDNDKYLKKILKAVKSDNMLKVKALREKRDS